ncbi:M23 family metallopeptidase [Nonomuraea sp. NPDC050783]|uniref:M23 family metallopeptidase n=1 Tax=Nonomuraea sp. NPDC050783 TaxID=3154634 RepID=UPI0034651EAF
MRAGHLGRWAAVSGAVLLTGLLTGACSQATGLAGVSARSPATAPPSGTPLVTATIPDPTPSAEHQAAAEEPPRGEDPVRVPPPKLSKYTYTFPVKGCEVTYERRLLVLPKTTIWAGQGCAFVAPVDGVVDEVNIQNRWKSSTDEGSTREGRFVTIVGDDGVRYLGGHLDSVAADIKPGLRVKAGHVLGRVGRTGNARDTGPNLYFAISWKTGPAYWWVRRGMVEPWDYLDAWAKGNRTLSPREETLKLRAKLGETPACSVQCAANRTTTSTPSKSPRPTPRKTRREEIPDVVTLSPTTTIP